MSKRLFLGWWEGIGTGKSVLLAVLLGWWVGLGMEVLLGWWAGIGTDKSVLQVFSLWVVGGHRHRKIQE